VGGKHAIKENRVSNRLPEHEAEFRLVDPIVEEYRQELRAYKVLLVGALANRWLAEDDHDTHLMAYIDKWIGRLMVSTAEHGSFDAGEGYPAVSVEVLDKICREWNQPPFDELWARAEDEYSDNLPDVYRSLDL
jgi:hypothetical protein